MVVGMNVHISKVRAGEGEEEDKQEGFNIQTDLGCELCMGFVEKEYLSIARQSLQTKCKTNATFVRKCCSYLFLVLIVKIWTIVPS